MRYYWLLAGAENGAKPEPGYACHQLKRQARGTR